MGHGRQLQEQREVVARAWLPVLWLGYRGQPCASGVDGIWETATGSQGLTKVGLSPWEEVWAPEGG